MTKKILFTISILAFLTISKAQEYSTGIGWRTGFSNGLTIKHFVTTNTALEFIASVRWKGQNITALYEVHNTFSDPSLRWYYGVGGHIGFWKGYSGHPWFYQNTESHTVIGVDGIIGIEYNFKEAPINVSIDYKPGFNLIGYKGFWGDEVALSLRYIIKK